MGSPVGLTKRRASPVKGRSSPISKGRKADVEADIQADVEVAVEEATPGNGVQPTRRPVVAAESPQHQHREAHNHGAQPQPQPEPAQMPPPNDMGVEVEVDGEMEAAAAQTPGEQDEDKQRSFSDLLQPPPPQAGRPSIEHAHAPFLDTVLDMMREAVVLSDRSGTICDLNTNLCSMFGYSREELVGSRLDMLMPEEVAAKHDQFLGDFYERLTNGEVAPQATNVGKLRLLEGKRKSGELFPVQLTVIPVQDEDRGVMLVGYIRDITHIVEAEESLAEAGREGAMREVAQYLLGYVNHELRNPLQGMNGLLGLLLEQIDEMSASSRKQKPGQMEAILDDLDALDKLVQMLERVVDDMQELRQVEENDLVISPVPTTVNTPLSAAAQLYARSCSAKQERVAFELRVLPQDTPVVLDPNRIVQVLGNFLSNAIKYTDSGVVTLGVERMGGKGKNARVRYYVRDTGRGIPQHKLEDVFRPYQQVLASDARMFGGTGLGLHLCKRIGDKVQGTVKVTSELGKGSEFSLIVPLVTPHTEREPEPEPEADGLGGAQASSVASSSRRGTNWEWISDAPSSTSMPDRVKGRRKPKKSLFANASWAESSFGVARPPPSKSRRGRPHLPRELGAKLAAMPRLKLSRSSRSHNGIVPPRTRFLVVDDGDLNRSILARMLTGFGAAEVLEASNGSQALEVMERCCAKDHNHVALVFMDLAMEGTSGVETTRLLRQRGFLMPVVGVSGDVSMQLKHEAREAGVSKVLTKPCALLTFRQCLYELQIAS